MEVALCVRACVCVFLSLCVCVSVWEGMRAKVLLERGVHLESR